MQIRSAVLFAYWLIFQLCWFLLVAMRSTLAINIALLGAFLLILYPILRKGGDKQMDKWFWFVRGLLTMVAGLLMEATAVKLSLIQFYGMPFLSGLPLWLVMLWLLFSLAAPVLFRFAHHSLVLASILGLIGGPMTYFGAAKLGAATVSPQHYLHFIFYYGFAYAFLIAINTRFGVTYTGIMLNEDQTVSIKT
jgi:hypothetical protein